MHLNRSNQVDKHLPSSYDFFISGFDYDGSAHLFQTDPSGTFHEWKANAIGRSGKTVREFLEKHYTDEIAADDEACIKLTVRALLEVVQSGGGCCQACSAS